MKKISYVFAVFLVASVFVAQPAHAQSTADIASLIRSLLAQVQELQRQIALLQVDESNKDFAYQRPILSNRTIEVLYPNGGETLVFGTFEDIVWLNKSETTKYFDVYAKSVKSDTGKRFLLQSAIPSSGLNQKTSFEWEVGTEGRGGASIPLGAYVIEVCPWGFDPETSKACDASDSYFKIISKDDGDDERKPVIKAIQAKAAEPGEIYATERAYIYGSGLSGKLEILFDCCKPRATATASGRSDGYAEFTVPKWQKNGERVAITVINGAGLSSKPYYVTITVPGGDDDDRTESIDVTSPEKGDAYKIGQMIPVALTVQSSDKKPDIAINLYQQTGDKERLVNQVFYKYEDGFVRNGDNKIAFYPAKGSNYDDDELTGTFRIEVEVGEIYCCKYWMDPTDADFTGWFTIGALR